jgi:hypothetical protein
MPFCISSSKNTRDRQRQLVFTNTAVGEDAGHVNPHLHQRRGDPVRTETNRVYRQDP